MLLITNTSAAVTILFNMADPDFIVHLNLQPTDIST